MEHQIKLLARSAKQRLKLSQYLQKNTEYKNPESEQAQHYIMAENKKLVESTNIIDHEEQILWQKVCKIMESDSDFISPISKLIDQDKYNTMDEISRQSYVLELTKKYTELKQRYIKEHEYLAKCN